MQMQMAAQAHGPGVLLLLLLLLLLLRHSAALLSLNQNRQQLITRGNHVPTFAKFCATMGVTITSDVALSSAAACSAAWYAAELAGSAFLVDATNAASSDFLT
jgi:hypothetical protein